MSTSLTQLTARIFSNLHTTASKEYFTQERLTLSSLYRFFASFVFVAIKNYMNGGRDEIPVAGICVTRVIQLLKFCNSNYRERNWQLICIQLLELKLQKNIKGL
jgi:hypothetical protein